MIIAGRIAAVAAAALVALLGGAVSDARAAGPNITSVTITPNAGAYPTFKAFGSGFGASAPPAANAAYCGGSNYNVYTSPVVLGFDESNRSFNAGEDNAVGVVVSSYSDAQVVFTLGSSCGVPAFNVSFYNVIAGQQFDVYVAGAVCTGTIAFNVAIVCPPPTPTPTMTATRTATATATGTSTRTATGTSTRTPTMTATSTATGTATSTPVPPTATSTATATPTNTAVTIGTGTGTGTGGAATPEAPAGLLFAAGMAPLAGLAAWRRRRSQRSDAGR